MRLGVRAHDFGKLPVQELAKKISARGFTSIQLALSKAIKGIDTNHGKLNPGLAYFIKETFSKYNIQIAVLGCYINPIHPDPELRKELLARFKEHLRFCRDFGCSIVGTETGSVNADYSFSPENRSEQAFQLLLESIKELVDEAEKFGVFIGVEGVVNHVISTPEKMVRLLDSVKSNNLQVIFDPVNLIPADNPHSQEQLIQDSFQLFGDRIVALHAKDFTIENGVKKPEVFSKGLLSTELLIKIVQKNKPYLDILLEDTRPETVQISIDYLKNLIKK